MFNTSLQQHHPSEVLITKNPNEVARTVRHRTGIALTLHTHRTTHSELSNLTFFQASPLCPLLTVGVTQLPPSPVVMARELGPHAPKLVSFLIVAPMQSFKLSTGPHLRLPGVDFSFLCYDYSRICISISACDRDASTSTACRIWPSPWRTINPRRHPDRRPRHRTQPASATGTKATPSRPCRSCLQHNINMGLVLGHRSRRSRVSQSWSGSQHTSNQTCPGATGSCTSRLPGTR